MKEINTPKGALKYRLPNVSECFDILACISDDAGKPVKPLEAKKKLIEIAVHTVDYSSLGYSSLQDMLNDPETVLLALSQIADEFYELAVRAFSKKKD